MHVHIGDLVGFLLAWTSVIPIFIPVCLLTLIVARRDLTTVGLKLKLSNNMPSFIHLKKVVMTKMCVIQMRLLDFQLHRLLVHRAVQFHLEELDKTTTTDNRYVHI